MSGSLRPSARYIGRGVTASSALEYMLYHQNSLAQLKLASLRLAAQHRVALIQLALVDLERGAVLAQIQATALREERDRVVPHDLLDRGFRDARRAHRRHGLRHLERIGDAPIGGAVDDDALGPV